MRSLACLAAVLPFLAFAQSQPATPAPEAASAPAAAPEAPPAPADPVKEIDALWDKRGPAAVDQEHDQKVAAAVKAQPESFEILWRAARWKVWQADGAPNDKAKEAIAKQGWELADKARALKPSDAKGHYYAAAAVGIYAQAVGILNALGQGIEGKFNERLDRSIQLDPTIDFGGPWVAKGRYFYELPWPMRDLKKSRELLEKATAKYPYNLRAQLYLTETLLKDGKQAEAKAAWARVHNNEVRDPAEARRVRQMAKKVEPEIAKLK